MSEDESFLMKLHRENEENRENKYLESHNLVTKIYTYNRNGKTIEIKRKYYTNKNQTRSDKTTNMYQNLIDYCSDENNTKGRSYKQITNNFNKIYHTKYSVNNIYRIINKCSPIKRNEIRKLNENLLDYLCHAENIENKTLAKITKQFNQKYNQNVSNTKIANFLKIINHDTDRNDNVDDNSRDDVCGDSVKTGYTGEDLLETVE